MILQMLKKLRFYQFVYENLFCFVLYSSRISEGSFRIFPKSSAKFTVIIISNFKCNMLDLHIIQK
jgi:hypothetical protein